MKKTLVVLTACMLAFGVAACGNDTTKETETDVTDEVHEYVIDRASDADDTTEKPSVPRKLVTEE